MIIMIKLEKNGYFVLGEGTGTEYFRQQAKEDETVVIILMDTCRNMRNGYESNSG